MAAVPTPRIAACPSADGDDIMDASAVSNEFGVATAVSLIWIAAESGWNVCAREDAEVESGR